MAMCCGPAHHTGTGTVPSIFGSGGMATDPRRIALSGILPRAIASAVLGAAELVWSHCSEWPDFAPVCGGPLVGSPAAVGHSRAAAFARLGLLPRPLP